MTRASPYKPVAKPVAIRYELHYGQAQAPLVRVESDSVYPDLWRMVWPDGRVSDIVNLSRAKGAAAALCERGPPARDPPRFRWHFDRSESPSGARPCVESAEMGHRWGYRPPASSSGKTSWVVNVAGGKSPRPGEPLSIKAADNSYNVIGAETGAILKTDPATTSEAVGWVDGFDTGRGHATRQRFPSRRGGRNA